MRLGTLNYLAIGMLAATGAAAADEPAPPAANSGQLEEVVVTAEKRTENIQQVPIAITALTAETLQSRGITDVHGMSQLSPNVNLDAGSPFSGSSAVLSASIRGIGQDDFGFNLDPGVGVYLDGVYLARTVGSNLDLPDVERVEILKGPQGTLFGRNTIGGAISIVTHDPGDTPSYDLEATTGSYDRHDFQLKVDAPITDTLLSTFTLSSEERDGYVKRIPFPNSGKYVSDPSTAFAEAGYGSNDDTEGGQDEQVARGKLVWKPTDDIKATLSADWTYHDQSATPQYIIDTNAGGSNFNFFNLYNACISLNQAQASAAGLSLLCSNRVGGGSLLGANLNPATQRLPYNAAAYTTGDIDTTYANGLNFDRMNAWGTALTLDYRVNDEIALKSITGFRRTYWTVGIDQDGSTVEGIDLSFNLNQQQTSQEFQLLGNAFDERLNYVVGLYYFNENGDEVDHALYPAGLFQVQGITTYDTTSYAGFAHADYKLTDQFTFTLGGRYSIDNKQFTENQSELNGFTYKITNCYPPNAPATPLGAPPSVTCQQALGFPNPSNPLLYEPTALDKLNFYEFTPTAGLQFQATPDLMAYATYSKGFKSGGWTIRLTSPVAQQPTFGPEKAETYEIGVKSEWFDHKFVANLAGFYTDYKGIQLNFFDALSPSIENGGDADILGSELETRAKLTNNLSLRTNIGYIDAYYTSVNPLTGLTLGRKLPKTPKWKVNIGPEYDLPLANDGTVRMILDFTHTSSIFNDAPNTPSYRRSNVEDLDASVTYLTPSGNYEVTVGGTNITNDRYLTTASGASSTDDIGTYNAPAEWYLRLRAHF